MAYAQGSVITAADYNLFANYVNQVWSSGTSSYGYGQTGSAIGSVTQGSTVIQAVQWQNLIDRINTSRQHQSGSAATSGIYRPNAGDVIAWSSVLAGQISVITANRFLTNGTTGGNIGALSLSNAYTNTGSWGGTNTKETYITWPSIDAMRYFFNSGGFVQWGGAGTSLTATTKGSAWNTLISGVGYVRIWGNAATKTGATGTVSNVGFWGMSTSAAPTTFLTQAVGTTTGGYNAGFIRFTGWLNAAPGSSTTLYMRLELNDSSSADSFDDLLSGTTSMTCQAYLPPTTYLSSPPTVGWTPNSMVNYVNTQT